MAFSQFGSVAAVQSAYQIRHVLTHEWFGVSAAEPSARAEALLKRLQYALVAFQYMRKGAGRRASVVKKIGNSSINGLTICHEAS